MVWRYLEPVRVSVNCTRRSKLLLLFLERLWHCSSEFNRFFCNSRQALGRVIHKTSSCFRMLHSRTLLLIFACIIHSRVKLVVICLDAHDVERMLNVSGAEDTPAQEVLGEKPKKRKRQPRKKSQLEDQFPAYLQVC